MSLLNVLLLQFLDDKADSVTCNGCGRSFAQDRIAIHERVCTKVSKENIPKSARQRAASRAGAMSAKLKASPLAHTMNVYAPNPNSPFYKKPQKRKAQFVFCYICGRQFTGTRLIQENSYLLL